MEWKTINSAPKDGTPVLLFANREGWEENGYSRVTGCFDGRQWFVYGAGKREPTPNQTGRPQDLDSCVPTHWMPLPPVPSSCTKGHKKGHTGTGSTPKTKEQNHS
jgi:hypothetical protein